MSGGMNDPNEMSEGEYLDSIYDEDDVAVNEKDNTFVILHPRGSRLALMHARAAEIVGPSELSLDSQIPGMKARYEVAKATKVGETVECPVCQTHFIKKSYQQAFCSNGTKSGNRKFRRTGKNCKDRYWNVVVPERRDRAKDWTER